MAEILIESEVTTDGSTLTTTDVNEAETTTNPFEIETTDKNGEEENSFAVTGSQNHCLSPAESIIEIPSHLTEDISNLLTNNNNRFDQIDLKLEILNEKITMNNEEIKDMQGTLQNVNDSLSNIFELLAILVSPNTEPNRKKLATLLTRKPVTK